MNKIIFILILNSIASLGEAQEPRYTIDFYVGYLRYQSDSIELESPKLITTTTSGLTDIIHLGKTKNFEFGIKVEILKSKLKGKLGFIVGKTYYVKKSLAWEKILEFCHAEETINDFKERVKFDPPQYAIGGGSTLEPIVYEVRQNDYYYISR